MGEWILTVGQIKVAFKTTKDGALGTKFNSGKKGGHYKYYAPGLKQGELPLFNPKNPQKDFVDVRYTDGQGNYHRADKIVKKYYDKEKPEVFISMDKMKEMYPLTKNAKVISKQELSKLQLKNISASDGYYLIPIREYENINKYKKVIEFIGDKFVITSPIRLRVRSVKAHNYAIFVDKRQNCLVAVEVLVKAGMQPEPSIPV